MHKLYISKLKEILRLIKKKEYFQAIHHLETLKNMDYNLYREFKNKLSNINKSCYLSVSSY